MSPELILTFVLGVVVGGLVGFCLGMSAANDEWEDPL